MKKIIYLIVITFIITSCSSLPPHKVIKISNDEFEFITEKYKSNNTDSFGLQVNVQIPQNPADYDESILANNFFPFIAFNDNCEIFFKIENIKKFSCYINNKPIKTNYICKKKIVKIKASHLIKNGRNILYIANLTPKKKLSKDQQIKMTIKIPYPTINYSKKKYKGISYEALKLVDDILKAEVQNGFPSIQLLVLKDGKIITAKEYGSIYNYNTSKKPKKVSENTLYDLASNTKIYATTFALQKLLYEKKISLEDKITDFFPGFIDKKKSKFKGKSKLTIRNLLTHTSGFRPGGAYHTRKTVISAKKHGEHTKPETLRLILQTPLSYKPNTEVKYSDINFILLTFIIEKITGMSLDEYVEQNIYEPLGLNKICFKPLEHGFGKDEIAATAFGESRHKGKEDVQEFVHGRVHDPECFFAMDEVSGHAGLFSNAKSLAVLSQMMINGGGYGTIKYFDTDTISLFTSQSSLDPSHALGWRRQGSQDYAGAFSALADINVIGHTGWTGTFTLVDRKNNLAIIICTNAKHTPHTRGVKYEGDYYIVRKYGAISSIIYSAFNQPSKKFLDSMLIEIIEKKFEMLSYAGAFLNNGYYKDLKALMETVRKRAVTSQQLRIFLRTKKCKQIKSFLNRKFK